MDYYEAIFGPHSQDDKKPREKFVGECYGDILNDDAFVEVDPSKDEEID